MLVGIAAAIVLAATAPAEAAEATESTERVATVPALDVERYAGTWYEVARVPNDFQRACVGDVTASYSVAADNRVAVLNRCRLGDGSIEEAAGVARQQGNEAGKLEVSFLPKSLRWLPVGWGDYWVVALDPDYRVAVVSDRERKNLWVLSREPRIGRPAWRKLTLELRERGFPVEQLVRTLHDPATSTAPTGTNTAQR